MHNGVPYIFKLVRIILACPKLAFAIYFSCLSVTSKIALVFHVSMILISIMSFHSIKPTLVPLVLSTIPLLVKIKPGLLSKYFGMVKK